MARRQFIKVESDARMARFQFNKAETQVPQHPTLREVLMTVVGFDGQILEYRSSDLEENGLPFFLVEIPSQNADEFERRLVESKLTYRRDTRWTFQESTGEETH